METTRKCSTCGSEYQVKTGLKNWKNLFRKPTRDDWLTLIILILLVLAAYAYQYDTKLCRETLQNLDTICILRNSPNTIPNYSSPLDNLNIQNITSYER